MTIPRPQRVLLPLLLALVALSLTGCVSAQERRDRRAAMHPEWLSPLSETDQVRILSGQIAMGDPSGAVWIALGTPNHTYVQVNAETTNSVWSYTTTESYLVGSQTYVTQTYAPPPPPHRHHHHGHYYPPPPTTVETVETYADREIERLSVTFANDRVVAFTAGQ